MPFKIVRNDITKMKVDAIVNAANPGLRQGGGVCGAIFAAAGPAKLKDACKKIGGCATGQAVITPGFDLPAKYIIHTVGPVWQDGKHGEPALLHDCYTNSLQLASQYKCKSIAFPLIASGVYGYPKDQALKAATAAITEFLLDHDMKVFLVVFDKQALSISGKLFANVKQYIDDHYVAKARARFQRPGNVIVQEREEAMYSIPAEPGAGLENILDRLDESFTQMLLRLIDERGFTDVETYKRANIDRKLFSKIRKDNGYNPSKRTAIALAVALELNLDQTLDLLGKAGYTLSHSNKFDVIIEYFITKKVYNIIEINEVLFYYDQHLLGA